MATKGALATLDTESALAEIASGVLSKQIAVRYGVSAFAVRKRLAKHPDYPQAIKDQAESFVEDAVCEMMHGELSDMVAITRARSKADVAFKYAAARDPANWGQKAANINIFNGMPIDQALGAVAGELLDKLRSIDGVAVQQSAEIEAASQTDGKSS